MKLKPGVRIQGIRPELLFGLNVLAGIWPGEMVVTSVTDGRHSRTSLHYAGQAADLRTRTLAPTEIAALAAEARGRLGGDFDLVIEPTHLHLEYQPKRPAG